MGATHADQREPQDMTDKTIATKIASSKLVEGMTVQTKQAFEDFAKASQAQAEKVSQQMFKSYDSIAAEAKQNVDALVQSGSVMVKGTDAISKSMAAFVQASFEQSVANSKALFGIRSMHDLVDLQTRILKSSIDTFVAESTRLSEMSVKVTNEALAPINARVNATVGKLAKPLAA